MNYKIVKHIPQSEYAVDISITSLRLLFKASQDILEAAISKGGSDSLLLFGLPGVGKTMLATSLAHWAMQRLPGYDALFIDCEIANVLPDIRQGKAKHFIEPWLRDLELLEMRPKQGLILVVDGVDHLFTGCPTIASSSIASRIAEFLVERATPTIVIGTARNPDDITPAILARFGKKFYVRPSTLDELSNWLTAVSGMEKGMSTKVSDEMYGLIKGMNLEYLAPDNLRRALTKGLPIDIKDMKDEPLAVARYLCSAAPDLFLDSNIMLKFEQVSKYFIKESSLLEGLISSESA